MAWDEGKAEEVLDAFVLLRRDMDAVARSFQGEIYQGLSGEKTSLRLLPTYVSLPTGEETGEYLAVDFGGTNVRATRIRLLGKGRYEVRGRVEKPLRVAGEYDWTGAGATPAELFGFIADLAAAAAGGDRATPYRLGHTFSFPSRQSSLADARLLEWTKELAVPGVEGEMVNGLLREALAAQGFKNIRPVSLINDTAAVLLAAAYQEGGTFIGSIYATGHNTCYHEDFSGRRPAMILNLESGGFSQIEMNVYDQRLDRNSEKPGAQRLEKMVSGRYLGELYGLGLMDILHLAQPPKITAPDLAAILSGEGAAMAGLEALAGQPLSPAAQQQAIELAAEIAGRSAGLVAATFAGVLRHRAAARMPLSRFIAVEGSLYEKFPGLSVTLARALDVFLQGSGIAPPAIRVMRGGAALGAALAAAMASGEAG